MPTVRSELLIARLTRVDDARILAVPGRRRGYDARAGVTEQDAVTTWRPGEDEGGPGDSPGERALDPGGAAESGDGAGTGRSRRGGRGGAWTPRAAC